MYSTILHYATRSVRRYFEKNRTAKIITAVGFAAAFSFLIAMVFLGFRSGFRYITNDLFFGDALFLYIVELFLLVSFLLVVASALISGIFTLFRSGDDALFMGSPRYRLKPVFVFSRMFLSSLWPLLVIILPALFAVEVVYGLPFFGFIIALSSVTALIALGVLWAMALLFVVAWLLYLLGKRSVRFVTTRNLTALTTFSFFLALFGIWENITTIDLVRFFQARLLNVTTPDLSPIREQFYILPTHFSAMIIYLSRTDELAAAFSYFGYFLLLLLISGYVLYLLGKHHLILWELFQEHVSGGEAFALPAFGAALLFKANTGEQAIFGKEVIAFLRNSRSLLWFGFILLIWLMQTGAGKIISRGLGAERVASDTLPAFVGVFQFVVIMYFVSMFVLRFAFPSFSSERKTAWLIGAAPVDLGAVFVSKLRFFVLLFSILTVVFALLNALVVHLSFSSTALLLSVLVFATLFLTTYGLSLGAIFPNFESDDPEVLSTTLPGIGFIFGALCYGALGAYALGQMLRTGNLLPIFLFIGSSLLLMTALSRFARR